MMTPQCGSQMRRELRRFLAVVLFAGCPVFADIINVVTDQPSLGANDSINWGQLPPPITFLRTPQSVTSDLGLGATITTPSGAFYTDQQGDPWKGNFSAGDLLIGTGQFDATPAGSISVTFATPVSAVGAQMGYNVITSKPFPFAAGIRVYDSANNLMATFTLPGVMDNTADNSAVFIGVKDSTGPNIARVEFFTTTTTGPFPGSFAINQLRLLDSPPELPKRSSLGS